MRLCGSSNSPPPRSKQVLWEELSEEMESKEGNGGKGRVHDVLHDQLVKHLLLDVLHDNLVTHPLLDVLHDHLVKHLLLLILVVIHEL